MTRKIILASASPRRKELLEQMGVAFTVVPSNFDEYLDHNRPPAEVSIELGLGKARAVAEQYPEALIIASDTIVTIDGKQYDKPKDIAMARQWLREHAGKDVLVTSSLVLVCKAMGLEITTADEAIAHFKPYDELVHETYLETGSWADKAGGWGIQTGAAPMVAYITGRFDTVLGLPTEQLTKLLEAQGIKAHAVEPPSPVPLRRR